MMEGGQSRSKAAAKKQSFPFQREPGSILASADILFTISQLIHACLLPNLQKASTDHQCKNSPCFIEKKLVGWKV
jgi:hypothetical protein